METQAKCAQISVRIPSRLKQLIDRYLNLDTHVNESDFVRDALREKINRDAPELLRELFRGEKAESSTNQLE